MRALGVVSVVRTEEKSTLNERAGRVVLGYLRLVIDIRDHLAWRTVITESNLQVGDRAVEALHALSVTNNEMALADVLELVLADPTVLGPRGRAVSEAVTHVRAKVDELRTAIAVAGADVEQQIKASIATFPASPELAAVEGELESLRLAYSPPDLGDLLAQIALRREEEEAIMPASVNIMSMHKAKGLDACVVIIVAAEEELIPGPNNRDEERRLFYVSLTRARHALFITHARQRFGQQARSGNGNPMNHRRTTFLDTSGLAAERGADFLAAFTPNLDVLTPLPNPASSGSATGTGPS